MRIGITYDLRERYLAMGFSEEEAAEFDSPRTIEGIERALLELGHEPERVGSLEELLPRLVAGQRWDLVFNIAEGAYGLGREAQIPALLEAYRIPCTFSDSSLLALLLHKGLTKHVLRDLGLATADFAVIDEEQELDGLALRYPLFVKPVAEGTGKGIDPASRVQTPAELRERFRELRGRYGQPVLVEEFLPGREFTVGILGTGSGARAIGAMEVIIREGGEPGAYSYFNKERCEEYIEYRLAADSEALAAQQLALEAWRGLGCRDAGRIDVRLDGRGVPNLIELNPLAGLHPEHSDLPILAGMVGIGYRELIDAIVRGAAQRVEAAKREARRA
jgi:D-alanine-D-alanine ligase